MEIKHAAPEQLEMLLTLYHQARQFMRANGNPGQWINGYPGTDLVKQDILDGNQYICVENGVILATFYYAQGKEPTYNVIYGGAWLNDLPYGMVHRICVTSHGSGVGAFCLNWAAAQAGNLRIDTHRDNIPMQHLLKKCGFTHCGRITLEDGSERLAYQKTPELR